MAKKKNASDGETSAQQAAAKPKKAAAKKSAAQAASGDPQAQPSNPAAKKGAKNAPAAKPAALAGPQIDTSLAAAAAAAVVGSGGIRQPGSSTLSAQKESNSFRQLKESLNKPSSGTLGGILQTPQNQKKSNLPFGGGKQVGRNQTFGADINRAGVPRRTGG